jgi:hypothetical protein
MCDAWQEVFAAPGTRWNGGAGGNYLIVGAKWRGDVPQGMKLLRSPTDHVWVIGRILTRDLRVARRRVELGMSEQHLDHPNIDILLQEVGGKTVPQRVRRHMLRDTGCPRSRAAGAGELACRHRLHRIAAREQPAPRAANQPPIAQQIEQPRRQWHDATVPGVTADV